MGRLQGLQRYLTSYMKSTVPQTNIKLEKQPCKVFRLLNSREDMLPCHGTICDSKVDQFSTLRL